MKENKLLVKGITYLERCISLNTRILVFYGMLKVCKQSILVPLHPVVATKGNIYYIVSRYIDLYLRKLLIGASI